MDSDGTVDLRPRTTGEVLDDAWRLALADAPLLLLLEGLFLVPASVVVLLLLTLPAPAGWRGLLLPALAAAPVPLTGLGSGACQDLFRRRAEGKPVSAWGCLRESWRRGLEHVAARTVMVLGVGLGLSCLVLPGLMLWAGGATIHAVLAGGTGRFFAALRELGREAAFEPVKSAVVTLTRLPLFVLAVVNGHLLLLAALWAASNLAGFDTALLGAQLSLDNPPYLLALSLLCLLL